MTGESGGGGSPTTQAQRYCPPGADESLARIARDMNAIRTGLVIHAVNDSVIVGLGIVGTLVATAQTGEAQS